MKNELWFKRKKYGWGWTPANGKGRLVIILYSIAVAIDPFLAKKQQTEMSIPVFLGITALLTLALFGICYWKGEKPEWQWGEKD